MLKTIPIFISLIFVYGYASAQTDTTAVKKTLVTDTTVKQPQTDTSVVNKAPVVTPVDTTTVKQTPEKPQPDSTILKQSPVKTLTYAQYDALMKGEDLYDMALPATLNHYPMPDEVIKYKKKLDLSPEQTAKITAIGKELHRKRLEMGPIIIKNERMLDSLFRTHNIDDGTLIFYANRYGLYQGEIRNAILQACYATEKLLSPGQVKQLEAVENHK